jgi:iron complex transport system permease protein
VSIIWDIRIPRAFSTYFVGAALSVSGCCMQSILQNPLASSYTLGVSSGASLGAALVLTGIIVLPISTYILLPALGFTSGIITVLAVVLITKRLDRSLKSYTIILAGMVISLFINGLLSLISAFSKDNLKQLITWQLGSFSGKNWNHVLIIGTISIVVTGILLCYSRELDLLTFGDETAASIGVSTNKVKLQILILTAILTGVSVCFTGVIGFVDLIVPHTVRKIFGPGHGNLIPACWLMGGAFMMLTDTIARTTVAPLELPVGAITAILGGPFFIWIFLCKRGE